MPSVLRALSIVLLSAVVSVASAYAQEPLGQPIVDVVVEGEAASLVSAAELRVPANAVLSRQLLRDLITRLIASGRWTDVQAFAVQVEGGLKLSLRLVARAQLARLDIRGTDAIDSADLGRELELQPGAQLSAEAVDGVRTRITEFYAVRGYRAANVQTAVRDTDDPRRKVLLIEIEEGAPTRIARIVIDGDRPLERDALHDALSFEVGDVLDQTRLADGVRRAETWLRRHGYLEATLSEATLRVAGQQAEVTIPAHVGPLYRVEIRGQQPLMRADVLAAMTLGEEPLTSDAQISAVVERVVDVYRRRGFVDAQVQLQRRAEPRRRGRAVLDVRVTPGAQLEVIAVGFPGARHFDAEFLESQVSSYLEEELPGAGLLSPVDTETADDVTIGPGLNHRTVPVPPHADPGRTFYAPTYEKAVEHLAQLYQAEGFLAVRVGPAQLQRASRNRAVVAVPITEGARTVLYDVTLKGNEALGAQELVGESALRRSMPFSYRTLEEARLRIVQLYKERGYLYAKVEPSVRFSQDRTRAEVTIEIVERFQVQVDSVVITGADRTDEDLIRDLVAFQPGDIYRPSIARESEERLLALGVFSGVTIAPEDADLPARSKRIEVSVTQRPSQIIDLKAGVSTGQGVRGGLEYGYRDLFGQAIGLTLRAELAYQFFFVQQVLADRYNKLLLQDRLERNITLSLAVPQLFPGAGVRTSLELFHVRDNQRDFGFDKNGVGVGFTAQPARRLTLTLNGDLENNNINLFIDARSKEELISMLLMSGDPADRTQALQLQRTRVPDGNSFLVAGRVSATYDRRDSPFAPTRGYYTSISSEVARTLKTEEAQINSQFVKLTVSGNGYVSLTKHVVLALQARAGYIVHLLPHCITNPNTDCSQTYPNRAFFMGGIDTVRGYFQDAMVPQDQIATILAAASSPTGMPTDDQARLNANAFVRNGDAFVLYRAELRFPILGDWHGATFTDLGNLWANPRLINPLQIRASVGAGLRLITPVGPLALDYGVVVGARAQLGEPKFGTVHFSMGLF